MCSNEDHPEDSAENQPEEDEPVIEEASVDTGKRKLRLAVAGCSHGEMDAIYATLSEIEKEKGYKFDLLICCGDYQSVRNYGDLAHMHVSDKFKHLRTFYKYYSGQAVAPILTLFVGGNHEASGFLCELPNGGWVAPRIYYLGFAGVVRFAGLRIAGLSGIFKGFDYQRGHFERPPFNEGSKISAYHVRNIDVWRLRHLRPSDDDKSSNALDIVVSHDWPAGITEFGDEKRLVRIKPHFQDDVNNGKLGNPATMKLIWDVRPRYWFAAHLHVMFPALVAHRGDEGGKPEPTRFLALDKPIPRRQYVQALEIEMADDANTTDLFYDAEWLAVLRSTDRFTNATDQKNYLPSDHSEERWDFRPNAEELAAVTALGDLKIPENFEQTATPIYSESEGVGAAANPYYRNPQSSRFCEWLGITDLNKVLADRDPQTLGTAHYLLKGGEAADPGEIRVDDDIFGDDEFVLDTRPSAAPPPVEEMEKPNKSFLDDFQAPAWKGSSKATAESSEGIVLKRRKVDLNEDE